LLPRVRISHDPETGAEITAPHILWESEYVDVTATEAMQAAVDNRSPGAVEAAKKFLSETMANGAVETEQIERRLLHP
jgi:hypothetical protein